MKPISRRSFLEGAGAAALLSPALASWAAGVPVFAPGARGPARLEASLDRDWLFGGEMREGALEPGFEDTAFSRVSLPHCPDRLGWQGWQPELWQRVWIYRRHFDLPDQSQGLRFFLHFDRVMAGAAVVVNGHAFEKHVGGFLPFEHEITGFVREKDNVLAVAVDGRWLNAPPSGSPKGPKSVDYLLPGGITGAVRLEAVPRIFIRDVFARPVDVLKQSRRLEIDCDLDAAGDSLPGRIRLRAELRDGSETVASSTTEAAVAAGLKTVKLTLGGLDHVRLWDVDDPRLYTLMVTLVAGAPPPIHEFTTRIGFRDANFRRDGFFLNGRKLRLFGLNRHELYPYAGFAAPDRLERRDAEILRNDFHCNAVRCSHYPQSPAFLDACDELGMLVWEEIPGWQYIGDESWRKLALRDVREMVIRDRNRPSIMIWGVRINESRNDPALYKQTREIAKSLDPTRATSGTMTPSSMKTWKEEWRQDVLAFDDYHARPDGSVGILKPVEGVPYMIAEAVGQFNYPARRGFNLYYRRAASAADQVKQAIFHAQAHDRAAAFPRCAGLIGWCAFEYGSLLNGFNSLKYPGISDTFRIPKLGAAFYLSQVDPKKKLVIEPDFYWDFGPQTPSGPGRRAAIFSNCEVLEVIIGGKRRTTLHPDRAGFPQTRFPPFFADLEVSGADRQDLRIDGYIHGKRVLSRSFSADRSSDRLWLHAEDDELCADGIDATWLKFRAVDRFGAPRPFVEGAVTLAITGPGEIVGDNPFDLAPSGGAGAVWIRAFGGRRGTITVAALHPTLGKASVAIRTRVPSGVRAENLPR